MTRRALAFVLPLLAASYSVTARADDTIRRPNDHPFYTVEVEPQALVGLASLYDSSGLGAGLRLSMPVAQDGILEHVNDSVAVSFGGSVLHFDGCTDRACGANYLLFPIAAQWNFFVAKHWSLLAEPGLFIYHGFFDDPSPHAHTGVQPAIFLGGRYHVDENVALTLRLGYPTASFGVSFM